MTRRTALLLLAALLASGSSPAPTAGRILDTARLDLLSFPDLVRDIKGANVVFVGEDHENAAHHEAELEVIRGLAAAGARVAVGLEMFRAADQGALDAWVAGRLDEAGLAEVFAGNWGRENFPMYVKILRFARRNGIPLVGLNVDKDVVREVSRFGAASIDARKYPFARNLACDADPRYRDRMREALAGHGGAYEFGRFCQAQILWDSAMAWNLARFRAAQPSYLVVVIAGSNHSWKHGIPERARCDEALTCKVILPSDRGDPNGYGVTPADADYVWRVAPS